MANSRYEKGAIVDVDTMQPGFASRKLTSKAAAIASANNHISPVGTQFIQPRVDSGNKKDVLLDDLIGPGWAIVSWAVNPETLFTKDEMKLVDKLGAKLVSVRPVTQAELDKPKHKNAIVVSDTSGALKQWFDDRPTPVVFLRPDRFIGAAGVNATAGRNLVALMQAAHRI